MIQQNPHQLSPGTLEQWLQAKPEQIVLLDVREDQELEMAPFPYKVLHLPLSNPSLWATELKQRLVDYSSVVVICHSGIRSFNFGIWLIEQGWNLEIWNLDGGIDAWSVHVDPSVPRY